MMIVRNKVLYESPAIFQVARSVYWHQNEDMIVK